MSMGIGKRYWVHLIKSFTGDIIECAEYMVQNPPRNKHQWYELHPIVDVDIDNKMACERYMCHLVEGTKETKIPKRRNENGKTSM